MNLEFRIRQALGLTADAHIGPRWPSIRRHYEDRIEKGMTTSYASILALEDLEGKAWHRGSRVRRSSGSKAAQAKHNKPAGEALRPVVDEIVHQIYGEAI